ncbi:hypothetical protein AVEN_96514-1 [Araneus ventricosus]|uniref:Uncharacterized protein n=1 Tax=Araneus ventricosus TaxID=182803 RepID=A0A4Y2CTV0_ARAVE|nr:hypothetical protein AVEN_96514-1 [Araneus ventricosus]
MLLGKKTVNSWRRVELGLADGGRCAVSVTKTNTRALVDLGMIELVAGLRHRQISACAIRVYSGTPGWVGRRHFFRTLTGTLNGHVTVHP